MESVFDASRHRCDIPDISKWDVSQVTNFVSLPLNHYKINLFDLQIWILTCITFFTSIVVYKSENMFNDVNNFNVDIRSWDISRVTSFVSIQLTDYTSNLFDII